MNSEGRATSLGRTYIAIDRPGESERRFVQHIVVSGQELARVGERTANNSRTSPRASCSYRLNLDPWRTAVTNEAPSTEKWPVCSHW
jgi:hypothetical protein